MVTPEKSNLLDLCCDIKIDYKLSNTDIKYKNPGYIVNAQHAYVAQEKIGLDIKLADFIVKITWGRRH